MRYLWMYFIGTLLLLASCSKESINSESLEKDEVLASWISEIDAVNSEIDDVLDQVLATPFTHDDISSRSCPDRTVVPGDGTFPRTITLDFGDACLRPNDLVFSGKILILITGPRGRPETQIIRSFDEFSVNGVSYAGTIVRTITAPQSFNQIRDLVLTHPDGSIATHQSNHSIVQIEGIETAQIFDDVFEIEGTANGISKQGISYSVVIEVPLIRRPMCPWPQLGTKSIERGERTFTIDYSAGPVRCNNIAIITLPDGTSTEIRLRRRFF